LNFTCKIWVFRKFKSSMSIYRMAQFNIRKPDIDWYSIARVFLDESQPASHIFHFKIRYKNLWIIIQFWAIWAVRALRELHTFKCYISCWIMDDWSRWSCGQGQMIMMMVVGMGVEEVTDHLGYAINDHFQGLFFNFLSLRRKPVCSKANDKIK
jgi:hypothetical protein